MMPSDYLHDKGTKRLLADIRAAGPVPATIIGPEGDSRLNVISEARRLSSKWSDAAADLIRLGDKRNAEIARALAGRSEKLAAMVEAGVNGYKLASIVASIDALHAAIDDTTLCPRCGIELVPDFERERDGGTWEGVKCPDAVCGYCLTEYHTAAQNRADAAEERYADRRIA